MSKFPVPKSILSNDSSDASDIISDLASTKIDEKSFINLLTAFDQKFLVEYSSVQIPKESKKRLQKTVDSLFKSLCTTNQPSLFLTQENSSILSVFVHTLQSDMLKSTKKKHNYINSIQKLFEALNMSLITELIDFHIFQKFIILLIRVLEILNERSEDKTKELICSAIMTLLKGASETFHKYYFDLFVDDDDVIRPRMSVYLNVGCEKNLVNLALACLNKTLPHPDCKSEHILMQLFQYLSALAERPESAESTHVIVTKNFCLLLEVLSKFHLKKNKITKFIQGIDEYLKRLWKWVLEKFLIYNSEEHIESFLKDNRPIGTLFFNFYKFVVRFGQIDNKNVSLEFVEKLPITMFMLAWSDMSNAGYEVISHCNRLQVQVYMLEFCVEFYKQYARKTLDDRRIPLKDLGLASFLMKKEIFVIPFGNNFLEMSNLGRNHWKTLWGYLCSNKLNISQMVDVFINSVVSNYDNYSYTMRCFEWLGELEMDSSSFLKDAISENFIPKFIGAFNDTLNRVGIGKCDLFLKLLNQLLCLASVKENEKNNLLQMLDSSIYLPNLIPVIEKILSLPSTSTHTHFKEILKKTKDSHVLISLFTVLYHEFETSPYTQKSFLNLGILFVIKAKLNPINVPESQTIISFWQILINCARSLFLSPDVTKKNIEDFDFNAIAEYLSHKNLKDFVNEISLMILEDVEFILYKTTELKEFNKILLPHAIPLIFQVLTYSLNRERFKEAQLRLERLLYRESELLFLASFNALDIILKYFSVSVDLNVSDFFEKVIAKIIPIHIPPQGLFQLLNIIKQTTNPNKKKILLQAVQQAVSNSDCQGNLLTPTKFFYFEPGTCLEFKNEAFESNCQGKITIVMWIKAKNKNNSVFFQTFCGKNNWISLEIYEFKLRVKLSGLPYDSVALIEESSWNFICVSIRSKKTGLWQKSSVTLCVNDKIIEHPLNSEKLECKIFNQLVLGSLPKEKVAKGNEKKLNISEFEGKISPFFVIFKSCSDAEIHEIRKCFINHHLNLSISTLRSEEFKVFKDIKKAVVFEWRPACREPFWICKPTSIVETCKRFNGVSLFEAIKLNGGLKIFLPLINMENQNNDEIISVTYIILKIFLCTQSPEFLTQEFIQLAGHVIMTVNLFSELTTNIIKIVTSLRDPLLSTKLLKLLLLNESINQIPSAEKLKHLQTLMPFISTAIECDRENLYVIYRHIKRLSSSEIFTIFDKYIPSVLNEKNKDAICFLLLQMCKDKFDNSLEALLNVLIKRADGLILENYLEAGLIYILEQPELNFHSQIIKIILNDIKKISENKLTENTPEVDRYIKLIKYTSFRVQLKNIDFLTIQSIFEVICSAEVHQKIIVSLLDIITNQLSYPGQDDENFQFLLNLIQQHINQLQKYLHQSTNFPDWICLALTNAKQKDNLFSLINAIFVPQEEILKINQLSKFARYVINKRDEESNKFLIRLLKKLLEDYIKTNIILKPESYLEFLKIVAEIDSPFETDNEYIQIISEISEYGYARSLLTLNPALESSFNKLRSSIRDTKENSSFRILIATIFKALNNTSNKQLLDVLRNLLIKFNYFKNYGDGKKLVHEHQFLIEIFVNLCEVNLKVNENLWLEQFIPETSIISKIKMMVESQSENEIKKLMDEPESLKVSLRSNTVESDKVINLSIASEPVTSKRKNSQDDIFMKERIINALDPTKNFPEYLKSNEWMYVQNYLIQVFGIRKIYQRSFDSTISLSDSRSSFYNEHTVKSKEFLNKYDDNWIKSSSESRNLIKLHIAKKYNAYVRSLKRQKAVLDNKKTKKFKVRPYFDKKNRQCLTKSCNPKDYSMKKVLIASSPEKIYNRSYSTAYFESFLEKSGEACSPTLEENENELSDCEEFQLIEEPEPINQPDLSQTIECERVTIKGTYFGLLQIHGSHLVYISEGKMKPDRKYPYSALEFTQLKKECKRIWENTEIFEIICRRFLHQHTALEIFLCSGKSYLFNVFDRKIRDSVLRSLSRWKNVKVISVITSKIVKSYTKKWTENKIDNFDYILALNRLASRSFHDMSQYPIFPWVLKDYTSDKLNINSPDIYRNFLYPIGAQDDNRREELRSNFAQFQDCGMPPFHHGSHYSNGGIVLHYLVRIEPFAYQARILQNNAFDVPDRLFISMENAWESCKSNGGDVKELIPELFFFPDMLFNINQYNFGTRQNGTSVSDFEYPPWAKSNWDFIRKHKKFLESQYVTENIHNWFDLIFGYKQTGQDAIKSCNVFHAYTYEQDFAIACNTGVDELNRRGIIEQAYHFGQTPTRLFLKQHPAKKCEKPTKLNIFDKFFKNEEEKKTKINYDIIEIPTKEDSGRIFALISTSSYLIGVKWDMRQGKYFIMRIKWEAYNDFGKKIENYELEGLSIINLDTWTEYQSWKSTLPKIDLKMILDIGPSQFAIWEDKYLVSAFHVDNTFKINSCKGELKRSIKYHCGLVTCVYTTTSTIFTGGIDSAIISWTGPDLNIVMMNIYLGHSSSIRQIQASENLQILISLASSGTILLHDIRNAECLRKLAEPDSRPARIMALSDTGIIAVAFMDKEFIGIFSINGAYWDDSRPGAEDVWCMMFNKTGEYLITGSNKSISFFDVFSKGNGLENLMYHSVDNSILSVAVSKDEEFIIYAINRDSRSILCCLKIENKEEKQSVMNIISQFT